MVPQLLKRSEVRWVRLYEDQGRCVEIMARWPTTQGAEPTDDETFCFALDVEWPRDQVAANVETARALAEDLRMFGCAHAVPNLVPSTSAQGTFVAGLWRRCVERVTPVKPVRANNKSAWVRRMSLYTSAADDLEREISVAEATTAP